MQGAGAERTEAGHPSLVLASASPQRRAILERLGVAFSVRPPSVAELDRGDPGSIVSENALRKARAAHRPGTREVVLGCDTLVALDGVIYGKPADERAARATLQALSGKRHEVLSGLCMLIEGESPGTPSQLGTRTAIARTVVSFRGLQGQLLDWYLATGEWRGRAGGYAIQGAGAALVRSVEGDFENVVGLPVAALLDIYPELLNG
jgi:septum formation protein